MSLFMILEGGRKRDMVNSVSSGLCECMLRKGGVGLVGWGGVGWGLDRRLERGLRHTAPGLPSRRPSQPPEPERAHPQAGPFQGGRLGPRQRAATRRTARYRPTPPASVTLQWPARPAPPHLKPASALVSAMLVL
jgi:hypothetical protein